MTPNLFILGGPKCGTTALSAYLAERPDVFFCIPKEPFFFSRDFPHRVAFRRPPDLDAYLALFAAADPARHRIVAEGSTDYLRSEVAVAEALALSPDARFIAMLRDPVEVAHAMHMEQVFSRNEPEADFARAWALCGPRAAGEGLPPHCWAPYMLLYDRIADFAPQIERLFAAVAPSRRLVLLLDDLRADPVGTWRRVLTFLDLPDDGRAAFPRVNAAHGHRAEWLADLLLAPPPWLRPAAFTLRATLRRGGAPLRRLKAAMRVEKPRPRLDPAMAAALRAHFAPGVARLEGLIDRDLSAWRRDDATVSAGQWRTQAQDGQ